MCCSVISLSFLAIMLFASEPQIRTWTDVSGRYKTEAEFVRLDGDKVTIRTVNGIEKELLLRQLSASDQEFAIAESRSAAIDAKPNQTAAQPSAQDLAKPKDFKLEWNYSPPDSSPASRIAVTIMSKFPITESSLIVKSCEDSKHEQYSLKSPGGPWNGANFTTSFFEREPAQEANFLTLRGELELVYVTKTTKLESKTVPFVEGQKCSVGKFVLRMRMVSHDSPTGTFVNLVCAEDLEGFMGVEFFDTKRKTVPSHEQFGSTFGAAKKPADDGLPIKFIKSFALDSTTNRGGIRLIQADATEEAHLDLCLHRDSDGRMDDTTGS